MASLCRDTLPVSMHVAISIKAISLSYKPPMGRFVKELKSLTVKEKKTQIIQLFNLAPG